MSTNKLSTATVDPKSSQEMEVAQECDRDGCTHQTVLTMTVTCGTVEEEWCVDCVNEVFGIEYSEHLERELSPFRFVTPATVGAFLSGLLLMLLIASVAVV